MILPLTFYTRHMFFFSSDAVAAAAAAELNSGSFRSLLVFYESLLQRRATNREKKRTRWFLRFFFFPCNLYVRECNFCECETVARKIIRCDVLRMFFHPIFFFLFFFAAALCVQIYCMLCWIFFFYGCCSVRQKIILAVMSYGLFHLRHKYRCRPRYSISAHNTSICLSNINITAFFFYAGLICISFFLCDLIATIHRKCEISFRYAEYEIESKLLILLI